MTPDDVERIRSSHAAIVPERFAETFYDTLFEIAPETRAMFPADLSGQRRKLMAELTAMVTMATSISDGGLDRFVERARSLGDRHAGYGVTAAHYEAVGRALIATLASTTAEWDAGHETSWARLYALVASTMQERRHRR